MLGNNVVMQALRHSVGDSQTKCAKRLCVTSRSITAWETKPGRLPDRVMPRIYQAYHVTPERAQTVSQEFIRARDYITGQTTERGDVLRGFDDTGAALCALNVKGA